MRFGQYIRKCRKQLGLTQRQVEGIDQGALSKLENGLNPTKREFIADLAEALRFPKEQIDWLWMYSLLDRDPRECVVPLQTQQNRHSVTLTIRERNNHHSEGYEIEISPETTEHEVLKALGPPDRRIRMLSRSKWIYEKEGLHIIFADGKVKDIMLK